MFTTTNIEGPNGPSIPEFPSQLPNENVSIDDVESILDNRGTSRGFKMSVSIVENEAHYWKLRRSGNIEDNEIRLYVELVEHRQVAPATVSLMHLSGVSHQEIGIVRGAALGRKLIDYVNDADGNLGLVARDFMKWMGRPEDHKDFPKLLRAIIDTSVIFITLYPVGLRDVNNIEKALKFFTLLLELGFIDLANTAEFVADEILRSLANEIRDWKFEEKNWNPLLKDYDPLIPNANQALSAVRGYFGDKKASSLKPNVEQTIGSSTAMKEHKAMTLEEQRSGMQEGFAYMLGAFYDFFKEIFDELAEALLSKIDEQIQEMNAFVIGIINGVLELVATFFDDIAFLLDLIDPRNVDKIIAGFKEFLSKADFKSIRDLFLKELKELFNFMDDDDSYKNVYEFGEFIPKILKIILDVILFVKATISLVRSAGEVAQKFNKFVKQLERDIRLSGIDKSVLEALETAGVELSVNFSIPKELNLGVPVKLFDGKVYKIKYRGVELFNGSNKEKVNKFLNELNSNPEKFRNLFNKKRNELLKKSDNFKRISKRIENERTKFNKTSGSIDATKINKAWIDNSNIIKQPLSKSRAQHFDLEYRKRFGIESANIATGRIKIFTKDGKLIFQRNNYITHSGPGDKIKPTKEFPFGSVGKPNPRYPNERELFYDSDLQMGRYNDSENALLRDIEEDMALVLDKKGLSMEDVSIEMRIETTYEPCIVCKREMLLRQSNWTNNSVIFVEYSQFFNGTGVTNNTELLEYLKL